MDLLEHLRISLLNISFVMIYIIHKMLFKKYNRLLFFFSLFWTTYNDEKSKA